MPRELEEIIARVDMVKDRRRSHENAMQEIMDLMLPFRGDLTTVRSEGQKRITGVFDTTAMDSLNTFSNFLEGTMFPGSSEWLKLKIPDRFEQQIELRTLADQASRKMLAAYSSSNFYQEIGLSVRDWAGIGNATMGVEEKPPRINPDGSTFGGLSFEAIPMRRMWWQRGSGGRIIFWVREKELPAVDAYRFFKGNPGSLAMFHLERGRPMEKMTYIHVVYPNENEIPGGFRSEIEKDWISEWISMHDRPERVRMSGFNLPPYITAIWQTVGNEEYGRGLGHIARPDAAAINELRRQLLLAVGRDLDPPLLAEDESIVDMDLTPGGFVTVRPSEQQRLEYLQAGTRYDVVNAIGVEDRNQIRRIFFANLLDLPDTQPRSAEQTIENRNRVLAQLSSPAQKWKMFLQDLVPKTMDLMVQGGALPEIEEIVDSGVDQMEIEFTSPFFTAQKAEVVRNIDAFIARRLRLFEVTQDPSWLDGIDPQAAERLDARLSNVPGEILRSRRQIETIQEERARVLEEQRQIQNAQVAAEVAANAPAEGS